MRRISNRRRDEEEDLPATPETSGLQYNLNMPTSQIAKIPRSEIKNAKSIYKGINRADKLLGKDLHKQDFAGVQFESARLEKDAGVERAEGSRLASSQAVKGQRMITENRRRLSDREYKDNQKRIANEARLTKTAIKEKKKNIRHDKREKRRQEKLDGSNSRAALRVSVPTMVVSHLTMSTQSIRHISTLTVLQPVS